MSSTGEVYLGLYGDEFEPDEVSRYIGLSATQIRRKGERSKQVPLPRNSAWKFSSGKIENDLIDVYELSEKLISNLLPYKQKIVEAKEKFGLTCVLQVVIWIDQDESKSMPAIGFEYNVIDFLKEIGGSMSV